jgi:hypothetical protein
MSTRYRRFRLVEEMAATHSQSGDPAEDYKDIAAFLRQEYSDRKKIRKALAETKTKVDALLIDELEEQRALERK